MEHNKIFFKTAINKDPTIIYTELFTQPSNCNLSANSQIIASSEESVITNNNSKQLTETLKLLRIINENIQVLNSKCDRLTVEIISIRSEISTIKSKVLGETALIQYIVPKKPLESMEQYDDFESQLESEETFKQFVKELSMAKEKTFDKFIKNWWKKIFCDQLAEQFS